VPSAAYEVTVFDANGRRVTTSEWLAEPRWTPTVALSRGGAYSWQLAVRRGDVIIRTPSLTEPEARFSVLTDEEMARVGALRTTAGDAPLVLGIVMARAGLLAEAERAFAQAAARYPESDTPARLMARLRALRNPSR
jgi:hypothetical protein